MNRGVSAESSSAGDDLPRPFEQHRQDARRLLLQPHARAVLAEFSAVRVELEWTEPRDPWATDCEIHQVT